MFRPLKSLVSALALCTVLPLGAPADARLKPGEVWLEIPELQTKVDPNSFAVLSGKAPTFLKLHIAHIAGDIGYGSVHAKVNTEAANIVMTLTSTEEGLLGSLDLARHGGFTLLPGRNSVEVEYKDSYQRIHYASFLLQLNGAQAPPSPPVTREKPAPAPPFTGERWAVIIGISKYENAGQGFANLRYADRDARSFRDFLLTPQGGNFAADHVLALFNEDATAEHVRSALFTFLTKPRPQDFVMLYLAGHGAPDPNDSRNLYFLAYDTRLDDMGGTAFPMWQLQDVFARLLKARRVVTFNDSCHAYGISGERLGVVKQNNLVNQYVGRYASQAERAVISASDISELSYEDERWGGGHGVFTFFLIKGLEGAADANKDGTVTAGELFDYLQKQVPQATEGQQNPKAIPGLAEALPLSGIGVRQARSEARGGPAKTARTGS